MGSGWSGLQTIDKNISESIESEIWVMIVGVICGCREHIVFIDPIVNV